MHEGKPIRRMAMVQLFASVLKLEEGAYYLVTPVEKVGISVEDCPFIVTGLDQAIEEGQQVLRFTTNLGESVVADGNHPISATVPEGSNEPHPILHIRSGLNGLLSRAVFYRLVELAEPSNRDDPEFKNSIGIMSAGNYFPLGEIE